MANGNCVADVRKLATAALKSGHPQHGVVQPPSKWASLAGYSGSAASPLRKHMARDSGNGCGRPNRYPPMSAETLLETLDLADQYQAEKEQRKRDAAARKIGRNVRPATVSGARSAKRQAKSGEKAKGTARKGSAKPKRTKASAPKAAPASPAQAVDRIETALETALS